MRHLIPLLAFAACLADGPKDNLPASVRPIPPTDKAVVVPEADRNALTDALVLLRKDIDAAAKAQAKHPRLQEFLPDLEIYHKAVDWALRHNEVFKKEEIRSAHELIAEGRARAAAFTKGETPWTTQTGLVVRGYRSRIDGSVQPYGMVIPAGWANGAPMRLDFWCHGRGETLTELAFMTERRRNVGQVPADGRLVLHLYGRYCCANKFAGEVDLWEAYEHARRSYAIDDDRLFIRGFSMGGAAVWQFGAHYADRWCGISPGAGFSETPEFLNVFQNEDVSKIPTWQKTLWGWYNASDVPVNFTNAPLVAYSGELDKQKQAADVMARELSKVGVTMTHIIGPQTAHKIHPDSMAEIERRLAQMASAGRDRMPRQVAFETFFLRYNRMHWVQIDRMESHWTKARIQADAVHAAIINVMTRNVTAFTLDMPAGLSPQSRFITTVVKVDGQDVQTVTAGSDRSFRVSLVRKDGRWAVGTPDDGVLSKRHGVSGPIDDAFMDAFLFVSPSGKALNEKVGAWTKSERERAVFEWRRQFRGDAPMKADTQVTDADIASRNLILWGDPSSNTVLARIADRLPIKWTAEGLTVDGRTYAAGEHAPVLVYPNPLNPSRYVVINSGFTYREYDYLNNARQVPKLPDWAVIDLRTPPDSMSPGKVVDAGFFDDAWGWRKR